MHVHKTLLSDTEMKLTISAGEAYLAPIKQKTLERLAKGVKVAGFREGKVPLNLVEKSLEPSVLQQEFLDDALTQLYTGALEQHHIRPVARPNVTLKKFVPFSELEFEAALETFGEIKLPDYTKMKFNRPTVTVSDQDVEDVLGSLQKRLAEKKDVERDSKLGDEVWIDFRGTNQKGEPVNGADGKDYPLILGSKTFIPGFEDNVLGMKAGEEKTFTLTFPKDYGVKALANKKVTFSVTVTKVQEVIEPKLDAEFAAKAGPFKTITELKSDIKKQLGLERQYQADRDFEGQIVKAIAAKTTLTVPKSLVQEQVERMLQELRQNLVYRGQTYEEYLQFENTTDEKYRQEVLEPQATERVKAGVILSEVAEQEKLDITPEELEIRIQLLKAQYKDPQMQAELDKLENRRDIAARMLTEKAVEKLVQYATKR